MVSTLGCFGFGILCAALCLSPASANTASGYGYSAAGGSSMNMGGSSMNMGGMNMNFNLSTPQGILAFLRMENINPASLVTSNCIANGNPCTPGGGTCCLSPVFSCQGTPGTCKVVPGHVNHIPQIQQIVQTAGVSTQKPIQ